MLTQALLLSLCMTAGSLRPAAPAAPASSAPPIEASAALGRALDSVSADEIRSDVTFIASDELGGRDTPSEGLRVAARFLRARLQRLGFAPGAENGYLYEYPLLSTELDAARAKATWSLSGTRTDLALGKDYFISANEVAEQVTEGSVVFAGTELTLEGLEVRDRWVLVEETRGSPRRLARAAREAGAKGILVLPAATYEGKPYAERYGASAERAQRARVRYPSGDGTPGAVFPTIWLTRESSAAFVPEGLARGALLPGTFTDERALVGGQGGVIQVENVCGFWRGSDPELSKEVIILSAHYDHVGTNAEGVIYNGADDNGSGTCGLLAVAEALRAYGPMQRSVLLMWVSGEEKGLWGSQAWTTHPWLPEGCRPVCDINIDMIGRNAPDKLLITPSPDHEAYNGLSRLAHELSPQEGFPVLGSADEYWRRSDHMNFNDNLKIPVAFLFSDIHEDYHKPTDDADKLDYEKIRRVVRLVLRMLDRLQSGELPR